MQHRNTGHATFSHIRRHDHLAPVIPDLDGVSGPRQPHAVHPGRPRQEGRVLSGAERDDARLEGRESELDLRGLLPRGPHVVVHERRNHVARFEIEALGRAVTHAEADTQVLDVARDVGHEVPVPAVLAAVDEADVRDRRLPSLAGVGTRAADRVPGMTAEEYLRESILYPSAYVVEVYRGDREGLA